MSWHPEQAAIRAPSQALPVQNAAVERYLVVIVTREGRREARRFALNVPVALARGQMEKLSDRALKDLASDIGHEIKRRKGVLFT